MASSSDRTPVPRSDETTLVTRFPALSTTLEVATLFIFTIFFLFYGLVPIFGGDCLGLVGADEPRYAQIAHEMLTKLDHSYPIRERLNAFVTPYLYGQPWLEKPALYYWRAMFAFKEFGVHDWSARLPSASFAFVLITLTYLHIRRFRPGGQLDAALITASCIGILGFARGASTDMQLAAPFCIGMLGWYAWYETDSKFWLFDLYFFVGAATLAKGPVAPFMAIVIIVLFAALRREWSILRRSIWVPGIILYLAMVLPWFIAVQHRNPSFLRVFFLEHNLERFATNRYQHVQPFWYYFAIMLLSLTPWTVVAIQALVDAVKQSIAEWKARRSPARYIGHTRTGDAFPEFLVLWALFPILFFSLSQSKLPGYILPAVPPVTILTGDYLNRIRKSGGLRPWILVLHAAFVGLMTTIVLLLPWHILHNNGWPPARLIFAASLTGFAAAILILVCVGRFGIQRMRIATMIPMVILILFLFGIGPFFNFLNFPQTKRTIQLLDATYSARLLSRIVNGIAPPEYPVAVYKVHRDTEYGLSFYRNHQVQNYELDGVPKEEHLLVVRRAFTPELGQYLRGRDYQELFDYPAQNLVIYKVSAGS